MNLKDRIYHPRGNNSAHADVFTRHEVVTFMLDMVGYTSDLDLSHTRILEPSCGNGEFVVEILLRLKNSSLRHGFNYNEAYHRCIQAYDIDVVKIQYCIQRIKQQFPELSNVEENIICEDFLLADFSPTDIVIGNPPYIRYEEIPDGKRDLYKSLFSTFHYRADIYVLFFEKSFRMLNPHGLHCFICANRWMRNQYGKKLRRMIASESRIHQIIDMEHTDAFHKKVLAYPAITLLEKSQPATTFRFASVKSVSILDNICFSTLNTPLDEDWSWVFSSHENINHLTPIERQGFRIGIGIATGADAIFVSPSLPNKVENELLLPVLNARNLSGDTFSWDGRYLLNPYRKDGSLICLNNYPLAKAYLESHYDKLIKRHKAAKNPSRWYATIDPIKPSLLHEPKIMLPDISGNSFLFVDKGEFYPQHNLYYITGRDERYMRLLAALLMSNVIRSQLYNMANHMNGGYARWQSQYLKKLRIPLLSALSTDAVSDLLVAYDKRDYLSINRIVEDIVQDTHHAQQIASGRGFPKQLKLNL